MAGKIFINYRRDDDPGSTGRLFDRLQAHFPREQLFMDVDSIAPGLDFVTILDEQVAQCDVFLAVIGRDWLDAADETGTRRLDKEDDFVRIEIESALKRGIRVIPVLTHRAVMPREDELPPSLKPFATRNAVRLNHDRFRADCDKLIAALEKALKEQREREVRREATLRGEIAPEQAARADELARWNAIRGSAKVEEFASHLARFPNSFTREAAEARIERLRWNQGIGAGLIACIVLPFQFLMISAFVNSGTTIFTAETSPFRHASAGPDTTGALAGLAIILAVCSALLCWRGRRLRPTDVAAAWLACALALTMLALAIVRSALPLFIVLLSAGFLIARDRQRLGGAEISLYWAGCIAAAVGTAMSFNKPDANWLGDYAAALFAGAVLALPIALISAAVLAYRRWPIRGVELSTYWLGCFMVLTLCFAGLGLYQDWTLVSPTGMTIINGATYMAAGAIVALAIGLVAAVLFVYPRRSIVAAPELRRYWFALSLVTVFIAAWLGDDRRWSTTLGAIIGAMLAAAAGGLLYLWWRRTRRDGLTRLARA